jgi:hypothetical protein
MNKRSNVKLLVVQDDQLMYPSSLENEWFLVILANSGSRNLGSGHETDDTCWEITRALKI